MRQIRYNSWNEYTGSAWQLTTVSNGDFVLCTDASKMNKAVNLCNPCTDSLIQWYQDNGIEEGD